MRGGRVVAMSRFDRNCFATGASGFQYGVRVVAWVDVVYHQFGPCCH